MLGILLTILSIAAGSAFINPFNQSTVKLNNTFYGPCYRIEPNVKLTIKREDLDRVHDQSSTQPSCYEPAYRDEVPNGLIDTYTRVRKNVHVIAAKIDEGSKSNGGCDFTNDLRWVGQNENNIIYWEDQNYQEGDLRNFVAVLTGRGGENQGSINFLANEEISEDYIFDFYAKDSILNNMPDFMTNCRESGGLVPVVEGESGVLPPQVVPIKDIDFSLYKKNYESVLLKDNDSFPPYKNYLIKIDKQDLPQESIPDGQIGTYITPIVNNNRYKYDVFYHLGSFYLRDPRDNSSYVYGTSNTGPPQSIEQHPSLQLGRLWFQVVDSWTVFTPNCKPAIYLYPEKPTDIRVKVDLLGKFTKTDPEYNKETGWNVKAYPDGTVQQLSNEAIEQSRIYPYLFYEALLDKGYNPAKGWVITRENITDELNIILSQLGLNEKESDDFLSYWVPRLIGKPYYFAGLAPSQDVNDQEVLMINPTPVNIIRVRLIFEGLDYPISVSAPDLTQVKRSGFTVVDWGGSVVGQTCDGKKIH